GSGSARRGPRLLRFYRAPSGEFCAAQSTVRTGARSPETPGRQDPSPRFHAPGGAPAAVPGCGTAPHRPSRREPHAPRATRPVVTEDACVVVIPELLNPGSHARLPLQGDLEKSLSLLEFQVMVQMAPEIGYPSEQLLAGRRFGPAAISVQHRCQVV